MPLGLSSVSFKQLEPFKLGVELFQLLVIMDRAASNARGSARPRASPSRERALAHTPLPTPP